MMIWVQLSGRHALRTVGWVGAEPPVAAAAPDWEEPSQFVRMVCQDPLSTDRIASCLGGVF